MSISLSKVYDVSNDRTVLHFLHVGQSDDVEVTRWGNKDVDLRRDALNGCHLETLHARLQGTDGVIFSNEHTSTGTTESESATLCPHRRIRTPTRASRQSPHQFAHDEDEDEDEDEGEGEDEDEVEDEDEDEDLKPLSKEIKKRETLCHSPKCSPFNKRIKSRLPGCQALRDLDVWMTHPPTRELGVGAVVDTSAYSWRSSLAAVTLPALALARSSVVVPVASRS